MPLQCESNRYIVVIWGRGLNVFKYYKRKLTVSRSFHGFMVNFNLTCDADPTPFLWLSVSDGTPYPSPGLKRLIWFISQLLVFRFVSYDARFEDLPFPIPRVCILLSI